LFGVKTTDLMRSRTDLKRVKPGLVGERVNTTRYECLACPPLTCWMAQQRSKVGWGR